MQSAYRAILWRFRITIVAMENQTCLPFILLMYNNVINIEDVAMEEIAGRSMYFSTTHIAAKNMTHTHTQRSSRNLPAIFVNFNVI
jgi:hypothetical protein